MAQARESGVAVDQAREEIEAARSVLAAELSAARNAFAAIKPPVSAQPLADRLGIPQWVLDLLGAGLGSFALNGSFLVLIGFAFHGHEQKSVATEPESIEPPVKPQFALQQDQRARQARLADATPARLVADEHEEVNADPVITFTKERLRPAKGKRTEWAKVYAGFVEWHSAKVEAGEDPGALLSPSQFGAAFDFTCEHAGIKVQKRGGLVYCVDRRLTA
jgi:hypothetical protein